MLSIPAGAGGSGVVTISSAGGVSLATVQRVDGSLSAAGPAIGLTAEPRVGKGVGALAGFGGDVASGAFTTAHTDLALPGLSGGLAFTRAYSTAAASTTVSATGALVTGPLGPKWSHNWQYRAWQPDSTSMAFALPGGQSITFVGQNGVWSAPAGVDATLVQNSSTRWTLTTAGQRQYVFSVLNNALLLSSVSDRNGNATTLSYDTGNHLTTVTDAGGRSLSLGYSGDQLTSVADSAGRTVHYGYDAGTGDLISVTDVLGGVTQYAYTGHWLSQVTDPLHTVVLTNSYDSAGHVATQTDAAGGVVTFAYASPGAGATTVRDPRNNARTYYFDTNLRVTDVVDAYGNRVSGTYDADNNTVMTENQLGVTSAATYDAYGNVVSATDAWNETSYFTYDQHNNRLTAADPLNHETVLSYDARGNLATATNALNQTASYTVNGLGQLTAVQDPRGFSGQFGYDAYGDRTTVTDPLNHTTTTAYDSAGRPTSVTDALNHTVSASYNAANEVLTTSVSPSTGVTSTTTTTYDLDGRPTRVTDPNGHTTSYAYDVRGLLSTVTDANTPAGVTTYGYDAAGNRTSVTDARHQTTSYSFDNDNRPLTVTDPQPNLLYTLSYDAAGRVATRTDGKNQTTSFSYTLRGQLDHLTYPDTSTVQYQYDALGNRGSMVDPTGTTSYSYDALSRLNSVTFPGSKTVGYSYDADGNRASITYPGGTNQVTYGYDNADRLTSVTDWTSKQTSYAYDAANRLTTTTLPATNGTNNVTSSYSYDNANRLTGITHSLGEVVLASASYTLDLAGNRTQKTTLAGNETYTLDALNRLTTVVYPDSTSTGYTYDAVGNRSTMTTAAGTTTYAYDSADRLTSVTQPGLSAVTNTFDSNDSQTARGSDSFTWDYANRLTSTTVGGTTTTMTYNGDGLRTSRTSGGTTTNFVWDIAGGLPQLLDDGPQYVLGIGLVAHVTSTGTFYFLTDGLGSTLAEVNSSGAVVQSYSYDAFGAVKSSTGTQSTEFQFAGQQTDPSGLQYLRARYYDPSSGRFLSRDVLPAAILDPGLHHPYVYANDNPAGLVDPSGMCIQIPGNESDCGSQTGPGGYPVGPEGYQSPPGIYGSNYLILEGEVYAIRSGEEIISLPELTALAGETGWVDGPTLVEKYIDHGRSLSIEDYANNADIVAENYDTNAKDGNGDPLVDKIDDKADNRQYLFQPDNHGDTSPDAQGEVVIRDNSGKIVNSYRSDRKTFEGYDPQSSNAAPPNLDNRI
ncbi:MAG: RHS repeat-associated core domain-containing protein [Dehalococcoidia bacterium]